MSEYVRKQALLDRINTIRNAHIEKRNEGDECDQFANEAVADWLWAIQEEIQSGSFDVPLIGIEEYYTMERKAAKAGWEVQRLRAALEAEIARLRAEIDRLKRGGWISVKDRTPEVNDGEWAAFILPSRFGVKTVSTIAARCMAGKWSNKEVIRATHWMPLPEPPKQETSVYGNDCPGGRV